MHDAKPEANNGGVSTNQVPTRTTRAAPTTDKTRSPGLGSALFLTPDASGAAHYGNAWMLRRKARCITTR